jgi:hypothetical protein
MLKAPGNLTVSVDANNVVINWADNSQKETSYVIERSEGTNQEFEVIGTVNENIVEFSDGTFDFRSQLYYRVQAKNAEGASVYSEEVTMLITTAEIAEEKEFEVYPNPANAILNIKASSGRKQFSFTNLVGAKVLTHSSTDAITTLDIVHLPPGFYIISTLIDGKVVSKKVNVVR